MTRLAAALAVSLLPLLFNACASRAPVSSTPGVVMPAPGGAVPGGIEPGGPIAPGTGTGEPVPLPDTRPPLNPALPKSIEASGAAAPVISLVKTARTALKNGRTDQAGASLERALRIEPRNAWVWQALSQLHVVTQQGEQAESEAKKSMSLGKRNPYLDVENWRLIAEARKLRGDKAGAEDAERKRDDLQRLIDP
jgi:tetratricopeptide (TPR) repeat protein